MKMTFNRDMNGSSGTFDLADICGLNTFCSVAARDVGIVTLVKTFISL